MDYRLKKYLAFFKIAWQNSFVYRLNFIMWRLRNVLGLLVFYFFWSAVFQGQSIFGWERASILTYILLASVVEAVVFSSRTIELAWKINTGEINNWLIKPLSIFKLTFSLDLADKLLNIIFSVVEIIFLILIFKPDLIFNFSLLTLLMFGLAVCLSTLMYFFINFLMGTIGFWSPEVWAPRFIFEIFLGFAAGSYFPLDFLPRPIYQLISFTPFRYLIYFPLQIYLKKINLTEIGQGMMILLVWLVILYWLMKKAWQKGLEKYEAYGI